MSTTPDTKINKLITAAREAFLYLEECMRAYDEDEDGPPTDLVNVNHALSNALGAIGAHPHAETDRRSDDGDELPF